MKATNLARIKVTNMTNIMAINIIDDWQAVYIVEIISLTLYPKLAI